MSFLQTLHTSNTCMLHCTCTLCSLCTQEFVGSLIMLASQQSGCYLNAGFINRPVYCCSRHRELTHLLTCTEKRSGGACTHTHTHTHTHTLFFLLSNTLVHFPLKDVCVPLRSVDSSLCPLSILLSFPRSRLLLLSQLQDKWFCSPWRPRAVLPALSPLYNPNLVPTRTHSFPLKRRRCAGSSLLSLSSCYFSNIPNWLTCLSHTHGNWIWIRNICLCGFMPVGIVDRRDDIKKSQRKATFYNFFRSGRKSLLFRRDS